MFSTLILCARCHRTRLLGFLAQKDILVPDSLSVLRGMARRQCHRLRSDLTGFLSLASNSQWVSVTHSWFSVSITNTFSLVYGSLPEYLSHTLQLKEPLSRDLSWIIFWLRRDSVQVKRRSLGSDIFWFLKFGITVVGPINSFNYPRMFWAKERAPVFCKEPLRWCVVIPFCDPFRTTEWSKVKCKVKVDAITNLLCVGCLQMHSLLRQPLWKH